jgi:biopolymer transport protein TolR
MEVMGTISSGGFSKVALLAEQPSGRPPAAVPTARPGSAPPAARPPQPQVPRAQGGPPARN